jgi:uncharacterized membrane protein
VFALISLILLVIMSVIAFVINRYKPSLARAMSIILLIISLISFGLTARTGYLGGQIRHTEISTGAVQNNGVGEPGKNDND